MTLDPQYRYRIRYIEPDGDVDDDGRPIYTGHCVRLSILDYDAPHDEIEALEYSAELDTMDALVDDVEHFEKDRLALSTQFARAARLVLANAENFYRTHGEACPAERDPERACACGFDALRAALWRYEKGDAK